jgi:DNA-binding transcriptional MerR regulator
MDTTRQNLLAIGAFADAAGLSLKALRLYDQLGILPAAYTDPDSGYRYYRPDQVPAARLIRLMRSVDMPLPQVRAVLTQRPEAAGMVVREFRMAREQHLVRVRAATGELLRFLKEEIAMTFEVQMREMPATQVVSITKRVKVDVLSQYIQGSLLTLSGLVEAQGGTLTGAPFGIYHGPVNHTDDGPLEVCFPARGTFMAAGDMVVKELSEERVATVRVMGEQCQFPEIIGAYDAAHDWITANGHQPDGPPREVWNGPDENGMMEIAWPFTHKE